jgi:molybdate transport system substrate-binding protein
LDGDDKVEPHLRSNWCQMPLSHEVLGLFLIVFADGSLARVRIRTFVAGIAATLTVALTALTVGGCSSTGSGGGPRPGPTGSGVTGTVTVFAAASLTGAFTRIGKDFEAANPGTTVVFNFAGSSALATQIILGAPADVFASAAPANMTTVTDAGDGDGTPTVFARNQLVIAVAKGNPKGVTSLADLTKPGLKVALCASQVPCGAAATKALAAAKVTLTPVTQEQDVKSALAKVRLGEVDAALVYRTDVAAAASDVDGVEFPESAGVVNQYPILALKNAPNKVGARAFVAYVLSDRGTAVLVQAGFQRP